jgi:hypothetical protein
MRFGCSATQHDGACGQGNLRTQRITVFPGDSVEIMECLPLPKQ